MRLLDVDTRRPVKNVRLGDGNFKYPYAILSHRWLGNEDDEVHLQDMQPPHDPSGKPGFTKIAGVCDQARRAGLKYAWVDSCCMDRTNAAEVQASINRMFRWYQKAEVCYVYLKDLVIEDFARNPELFERDEWFRRGWTLQELIAPREVKFFDRNWQYLGDKQGLKLHIYCATGIDLDLLEGKAKVGEYSVAARMSWAAERYTREVEDHTYSLFGLFGINIPMLYGEGSNAFRRLQEEIIKTSDDHSIFAWRGVSPDRPGLLAPSIEHFKGCGAVRTLDVRANYDGAYGLTNRGVSITLQIKPWTLDTYLARLDCGEAAAPGREDHVHIFLRKLRGDDQYARVRVGSKDYEDDRARIDRVETPTRVLALNVRQMPFAGSHDVDRQRVYGIRFADGLLEKDGQGKALYTASRGWDAAERMVTQSRGVSLDAEVGHLDICQQRKQIRMIRFFFDFDFNPIVILDEWRHEHIPATRSFLAPHGWLLSHWEARLGGRNRPDASRISLGPPGIFARPRVGQDFWALKGDRLTGLDMKLGSAGRVVLAKVATDAGDLVWQLSIHDMARQQSVWQDLWRV